MNKRISENHSSKLVSRNTGSYYARAAFDFNAAFFFSGYFTSGRLYSS
jgi:hypothetical protein